MMLVRLVIIKYLQELVWILLENILMIPVKIKI